MHLEELKELNRNLFNNIQGNNLQRIRAFEERIYSKIRDMAFKGETIGFLITRDFGGVPAKEFNKMVDDVRQLLLPYFTIVNLTHQVRIDAVDFTDNSKRA